MNRRQQMTFAAFPLAFKSSSTDVGLRSLVACCNRLDEPMHQQI